MERTYQLDQLESRLAVCSDIWDLSPYVGHILWGLRIGSRRSQAEVAKLMADELKDEKIDPSYISRVEHGETISLKRLSLLCHVLGFKVSRVLELAEEAAARGSMSSDEQVAFIDQRLGRILDSR